ncbi:MAG: ATP-binding protein [Pseudomonadota bacterium]
MTVPLARQPEADLERLVAARTAELSELLNFVTNSWDQEKRALSRQLHDSLGSSLTAMTMHLGLLARQLPDDPLLQERATLIKQLLASVISRNRDTQAALWNDKFEFLGIEAALGELIEQFASEQAMAAHLQLPQGDFSCSHEHGLAVLRCAEEALRNVAAHARARSVELTLEDSAEVLTLSVRDDGVGLAAHAAPAGHSGHGLRLLRARAASLGGEVRLAAQAGAGCCLTLSLPKAAQS